MGKAALAFAVGPPALFVVTDSELVLIGTLQVTVSTMLADYQFML
jgi:hypothetical protein